MKLKTVRVWFRVMSSVIGLGSLAVIQACDLGPHGAWFAGLVAGMVGIGFLLVTDEIRIVDENHR